MTVSELIADLLTMPQDSIVILQKDAEGNGYSPLSVADPDAVYVAESTWSGSVYSTHWTPDEACMEDTEWEEFKQNNPSCVVLAPIN